MPDDKQTLLPTADLKLEPPAEVPPVVMTEPAVSAEDLPTSPELPPMTEPTLSSPLPEVEEVDQKPAGGGVIKRFLSVILILLIISLGGWFLYKKFFSKGRQAKEITLTYWGLWEPEEVVKGVILDWEKDHPGIKINYLRQNHKEYRERLQSALARNEGPDLFRFHITWLPMLKNELEPMPASVMSASQAETSFYPVVAENLRSGTNYLGLPLMIDNLALYYNEDIFQAAGKSPPTTWEDLRQTAADLTVKDESGNIQIAGVGLGTTSNVDHWSDILGLMMLQNGADLSNPAECSQQAGKEVCLGVDALTFYTIFKSDGVWSESLPTTTQAFAAGKLAMYFGPSWRVFDLEALNPNLKFKIMPVPQLPEVNTNWATFWVEGVASKSKFKNEAWEFLKFLSLPETLEKLYAAASNTRVFGEPYPRVEMADKLKSSPLLAPFLNQASKAKTWYLCSDTYDNGINDRMIKYYEDAVNAINSGKPAKASLQTTTEGIAQLLTQYGISSAVVR